MDTKNGSVISGMIWMLLISILLFWLPVFGPLVAGVVGGMKSGGVGKALMAVFLPAVLLGFVVTLIPTLAGAVSGVALIGAIAGAVAGLGVLIILLSQVGMLLLGAIIGGILA